MCADDKPFAGDTMTQTKIWITVNPRKGRDRRSDDVTDRARNVLTSFRSYLMASEEDADPAPGVLTRAKRVLVPWLAKS